MAKSKKMLTAAQKAANAIRKPKVTAAHKLERARKQLLKHPNDKCAKRIVAEAQATGVPNGPVQNHKPGKLPDSVVKMQKRHSFQMKHPEDRDAGDYFRTPHHLTWKTQVRVGVSESMADLFAERFPSDPFIYDRMYTRISQGLGHLEDYTFKKDSMVRHA